MRPRLFASVTLMALAIGVGAKAARHRVFEVRSADGAPIEVECAGAGPELLIVYGGIGDRTRWTPMFPLLERDFTVCAMDRRAHGKSGDRAPYSLAKEAQDVVAVVRSQPGPVTLLGHSFGGVVAYEAAFGTPQIAKLILYEPPMLAADHRVELGRMEALIRAGDREAAATVFLREVVKVSPEEMAAMKARPSWNGLVASIETSIRQDRALSAHRWDASRAKSLPTPALLLIGARTTSPELRRSIQSLAEALPHSKVLVLEGEEHNAMDTDREGLAAAIRDFALPVH